MVIEMLRKACEPCDILGLASPSWTSISQSRPDTLGAHRRGGGVVFRPSNPLYAFPRRCSGSAATRVLSPRRLRPARLRRLRVL